MAKPWLRLHCSTLDSPKIAQLGDKIFRFWVEILLVSAKFADDGSLPSVKYIAFAVRKTETKVSAMLQELIDVGLVERGDKALKVHDWDWWQFRSDSSTQRSRKHRMQRCKDVAESVASSGDMQRCSNALQIQTQIQNQKDARDLVPIFERCYAASMKRQQRGIAERYFVDAAATLDPAIIETRWLQQNQTWAADGKFAKGVQNFAEWLLDRNYQFDPNATEARIEAETPLWAIEAREAGI